VGLEGLERVRIEEDGTHTHASWPFVKACTVEKFAKIGESERRR